MNESFGSINRKRIIFSVVISFALLLIVQLFKMQIIQHDMYLERSNINSIKGIEEESPRGVFLDRNNEVIVSNKPAFSMQIIPSEFEKSLSPVIEKVINEDTGYIRKVLRLNRVSSPYIPRKIKRDVNFDFVAWYEENHAKLPGVEYTVDIQRDYSFGINGSHLFGYTKEISAKQLEYPRYKDKYSIGDYIGAKGIEKIYEEYVRGEKGVTFYLVDSKQRRIGRYKNGEKDIMPQKGHDLVLTIDAESQRVAEKGFEGKKGAIVAVEPSTGEIIAFVSSPNYDLNIFSTVTSEGAWGKLQIDPEKPLFNRATMTMFPAGSTFKVLLAMAGLEMGIIDENSTLYCAGGYSFGRFYKCHGGVHGALTVKQAIEKSCNSFFYQLILKVGLDNWANFARMFGFGQKTGIDIDNEGKGLLPDTRYYDKRFGKKQWSQGLLLNLSIGQGELGVTPVQLAKYVSLIANNGKSKIPHLVRGYYKNGNKDFVKFNFNDINVNVSQKTFDIVKEGMFNVVNGPGGTATFLKIPDITMAGKTGTAQNPHGKDHALFIGYAPADKPEIAVAVMVENVGFGSTWAGPIARDVIKTYIEGKRQRDLMKSLKRKSVVQN